MMLNGLRTSVMSRSREKILHDITRSMIAVVVQTKSYDSRSIMIGVQKAMALLQKDIDLSRAWGKHLNAATKRFLSILVSA